MLFSSFALSSSERTWVEVRGFYINLVWLEKLGFHGYSSDWKLDIVKGGMSDWPGSDRKIMSQSNFKIRFSERSLDLVRGFLFQFGVV